MVKTDNRCTFQVVKKQLSYMLLPQLVLYMQSAKRVVKAIYQSVYVVPNTVVTALEIAGISQAVQIM